MTIKLLVPETLWRDTSTLMRQYARKRVEAGCFWYGLRNDNSSIAATIGIPRQKNRPGNFHVHADDLASLVTTACGPGLVTVAQLHLHPDDDVDHSSWDNGQIVSRKILSIVIPNYGAQPFSLGTLGVHIFEHDQWRRLSAREAQEAVQVIRTVVDTR